MASIRVVEDTPEIALLAKFHLEEAGHRVATTTGNFERLLSHRPWEGIEVAIVDLMLPVVSGYEILEWLSQNREDIRRVAFTASIPSASDVIGLADVTLIKPTTKEELLRSVEGHL